MFNVIYFLYWICLNYFCCRYVFIFFLCYFVLCTLLFSFVCDWDTFLQDVLPYTKTCIWMPFPLFRICRCEWPHVALRERPVKWDYLDQFPHKKPHWRPTLGPMLVEMSEDFRLQKCRDERKTSFIRVHVLRRSSAKKQHKSWVYSESCTAVILHKPALKVCPVCPPHRANVVPIL